MCFARTSRPQGRPTADERGASTDQPSEMEEAFRRAGDRDFRQDPEFEEFRDVLSECVENGNVWPALETASQVGEERTPETAPAPEAVPAPGVAEASDATMAPAATATRTVFFFQRFTDFS